MTIRHHQVYSDTMARTQVYLGAEELALLDKEVRTSGATRSELIRRAVRTVYGQSSVDDKLRALEVSAGSWKDRSFTGAEYVDSIRSGDLNERLRRLGIED